MMGVQSWLYFIIVVAHVLDGLRCKLSRSHMTGVIGSSRSRHRLSVTESSVDAVILKKIDRWACVKNCGACCKLGPLDSRPDLESYLTPSELSKYKSMIGPDDWCVNFDKATRMCTVYDDRPDFCRVEPQKFKAMYGIEEDELNDFCAFCCREQISDVYGEESTEMETFEDVIESLMEA